jgi:hypothetical protein
MFLGRFLQMSAEQEWFTSVNQKILSTNWPQVEKERSGHDRM